MTDSAMIELDQVRFAYRDNGFSLHVAQLAIDSGAHVACIGPSGSGKTTLVNLIAGILVPESGTVRLAESTISNLDDGQRRALRIARIGMVFQEFELLEYLSSLDNILLPFHINSALKLSASVTQRALTLAESMGIGHVVRRRPRRLSQGERQRVAICRALVTSPELVICDEPTGNLDPETAAVTLDLLFEQVRQHEATLLMVTHNHAILDRFDRVIDMRELITSATKEGVATR